MFSEESATGFMNKRENDVLLKEFMRAMDFTEVTVTDGEFLMCV